MGTNFYVKGTKQHLGKRSPAGWYCWNCRVTLCADGEVGVHRGESEWYNFCPQCGLERPEKASLSKGAVARELGFDKSPFCAKVGVDTCSSFSWAANPEGEEYKKLLKRRGKPIKNEYDNAFSVKEWLAMLEECPITYIEHVGSVFS